MKKILTLTVVLSVIFSNSAYAICGLKWENIGKVPDYQVNAKPQGLTFYDAHEKALVFSNHYESASKEVTHGSRIYYIPLSEFPMTDAKLAKLKSFTLSPKHKHVAGLAVEGATVFAVDYRSNQLLQVPLLEALQQETPYKYQTTDLKGLSGLEFKCEGNDELFGVSEFKVFGDCSTGLYSSRDRMKKNSNQPISSYTNVDYSQGLTFATIDDVDYLVESVNKGSAEGMGLTGIYHFGIYGTLNVPPTKDEIRFYDLSALKNGVSEDEAHRMTLPAPGPMVEDLAWDGEYLYTTDEYTMNFYRGTFIPCK
jgi:hypothetical protein